jgi:hypothetical protein
MPARAPLLILAVVAAFLGGLVSSRLFERDAYAQKPAFSSTFYVPRDGLAFRTLEGRVIAKLSYDERGGTFELYDGLGRPSTSFRAGSPPSTKPAMSEVHVPVDTHTLDLGY